MNIEDNVLAMPEPQRPTRWINGGADLNRSQIINKDFATNVLRSLDT